MAPPAAVAAAAAWEPACFAHGEGRCRLHGAARVMARCAGLSTRSLLGFGELLKAEETVNSRI